MWFQNRRAKWRKTDKSSKRKGKQSTDEADCDDYEDEPDDEEDDYTESIEANNHSSELEIESDHKLKYSCAETEANSNELPATNEKQRIFHSITSLLTTNMPPNSEFVKLQQQQQHQQSSYQQQLLSLNQSINKTSLLDPVKENMSAIRSYVDSFYLQFPHPNQLRIEDAKDLRASNDYLKGKDNLSYPLNGLLRNFKPAPHPNETDLIKRYTDKHNNSSLNYVLSNLAAMAGTNLSRPCIEYLPHLAANHPQSGSGFEATLNPPS